MPLGATRSLWGSFTRRIHTRDLQALKKSGITHTRCIHGGSHGFWLMPTSQRGPAGEFSTPAPGKAKSSVSWAGCSTMKLAFLSTDSLVFTILYFQTWGFFLLGIVFLSSVYKSDNNSKMDRITKRYYENNLSTIKPYLDGHAPVLADWFPEPEFSFIP